jgi:hypothetical protein
MDEPVEVVVAVLLEEHPYALLVGEALGRQLHLGFAFR